MRSFVSLALAGLTAAAASSNVTDQIVQLPMDAVPEGVQEPSKAGFENGAVFPARGGKAVCVSGTIPVQAHAQNMKFNYKTPTNQSEITQTFLSMVSSGSTFMEEIAAGMQNVSGTYNIFGTLCLPSGSAKPSTVQILTHGIGFNRLYWDYAPGYSYVDVAASAGYATFAYDRLGVGFSSKPDPLNTVQSPLELAIAQALVEKLRAGSIGDMKFSKVVAVGHSFGSIISEALAATAPQLLDATILTGFSMNMTGLAPFILGLNLKDAKSTDPLRFGEVANGYLIAGDPVALQTAFFSHGPGGFDPKIVPASYASAGDDFAIGELFTQGAISKPAMNFTGPVAIVNGDADLPFCFGNCSYPVDKAQAPLKMLFPESKNATSYLAKDAGHGLNLHYSALAAYHFIQDFLKGNGL